MKESMKKEIQRIRERLDPERYLPTFINVFSTGKKLFADDANGKVVKAPDSVEGMKKIKKKVLFKGFFILRIGCIYFLILL